MTRCIFATICLHLQLPYFIFTTRIFKCGKQNTNTTLFFAKQETIMDQTRSESESHRLIQELIAVSLYCISYLRGLFPEDYYYDCKYYDTAEPSSDSNFILTKKLQQKGNNEINMFINYIDKGINEAIKLEYLKGVLFEIFLSKEQPELICESYLFTINYLSQQVSLNDAVSFQATTNTIIQSILGIIKRLILLTQTFDRLPDKKYFAIRLLFNESCPVLYQPPYFQDTTYAKPSSITVEQEYSGLEIGQINAYTNCVKMNILVETCKMENCNSIDPFDLVDKQKYQCEALSSCDVDLDEYLDHPNTIEVQILEPKTGTFDIANCRKCNASIYPVAYGYDKSFKNSITCFKCLLQNRFDDNLGILMSIRLLWQFYMMNEFPSFEKSKELIQLVHTGSIVHVFNKMFSDKLLVVTNKAMFRPNTVDFIAGCGSFIPAMEGIVANDGKQLQKYSEYFVSFVPRMCTFPSFFAYDKKLDSLYFPNYLVQRADFVLSNLRKFKAGSPGRHIVRSSSSSSVSLQLSKTNSKSGTIRKLKSGCPAPGRGRGRCRGRPSLGWKNNTSVSQNSKTPSLVKPSLYQSGSVYSQSNSIIESTNDMTPLQLNEDSSPTTVVECSTQNISETLDDLSFEESLQYLSQSQEVQIVKCKQQQQQEQQYYPQKSYQKKKRARKQTYI